MREKLQTPPPSELKEIVKSRGIRGISPLRKVGIIDLLCAETEKNLEVKPMEIKGEEKAETPRNQEASRSQGAPHSQEAYRPQDQFRAPERNQSKGQDYQGNRNDSRGTNNHHPVSKGYDNKYTQNRVQPPGSYGSSGMNNGMSQNSTSSQSEGERFTRAGNGGDLVSLSNRDMAELGGGIEANDILEVTPGGFRFIRCENFLPGENDVCVVPSQIRRFSLKTGDIIVGNRRVELATEKFAALLHIKTVNDYPLSTTETRPNFEGLTPTFSNRRLYMETPGERNTMAMRVLDLLAPIGRGQRDMIVSPPKVGKTTPLKQAAKVAATSNPDIHLIILLIDERPEEATDIKEAIVGPSVEITHSIFDELPNRHKRISEMVIEQARRLVEHGRNVIILLDSITKLARVYDLTVAPNDHALSDGLNPAALHMPKRFFGMTRNMREGGSLTVLAIVLVEMGSHMDDAVYKGFKGIGNMELVLDRKLSEKHIFPATNILESDAGRDDLLLSREEAEAADIIRETTNSLKPEDVVEKVLDLFVRIRNNRELMENAERIRFF